MYHQQQLQFHLPGRGSRDISTDIEAIVAASGVQTGLCHVFVQHTSCSLMICENADPSVRADLETIMQRLAPDGDPAYRHDHEGPDDMPAHIRSILTHTDLTIPISGGRLGLGTWQGVFLWEHRTHPHTRRLTVTVHGE